MLSLLSVLCHTSECFQHLSTEQHSTAQAPHRDGREHTSHKARRDLSVFLLCYRCWSIISCSPKAHGRGREVEAKSKERRRISQVMLSGVMTTDSPGLFGGGGGHLPVSTIHALHSSMASAALSLWWSPSSPGSEHGTGSTPHTHTHAVLGWSSSVTHAHLQGVPVLTDVSQAIC